MYTEKSKIVEHSRIMSNYDIPAVAQNEYMAGSQQNFPHDICVPQLIARKAAATPEAVAVMFGEQKLTYRELNQRANQLANYLQALGVGPNVLVGLCVERSLEMAVGLLGILKAGGAYVPLDSSYPSDRLAFMIEDAQAP